jgi:hypothetical protein
MNLPEDAKIIRHLCEDTNVSASAKVQSDVFHAIQVFDLNYVVQKH